VFSRAARARTLLRVAQCACVGIETSHAKPFAALEVFAVLFLISHLCRSV
jgi:hypothetical protein